MSIDYDALRAVAEAATPGPWTAEAEDGDVWTPGNRERLCKTSSFNYGRDATYIAAASPDVVLALLDEVEALRAKVARVREVIDSQSRRVSLRTRVRAALDGSNDDRGDGR